MCISNKEFHAWALQTFPMMDLKPFMGVQLLTSTPAPTSLKGRWFHVVSIDFPRILLIFRSGSTLWPLAGRSDTLQTTPKRHRQFRNRPGKPPISQGFQQRTYLKGTSERSEAHLDRGGTYGLEFCLTAKVGLWSSGKRSNRIPLTFLHYS